MPDDSAIRMQRMRNHRNGRHEFCNEDNCRGAVKLANNARHVIANRAILEFCWVLGVPWEHLGSQLPNIRKLAQMPIPEAMADAYKVDISELMQARFTVEEILRGNGHDWECGPLPLDAVERISQR